MAKQEYKVMGLSDTQPVIVVEADSYEEAVELAKAQLQEKLNVDVPEADIDIDIEVVSKKKK